MKNTQINNNKQQGYVVYVVIITICLILTAVLLYVYPKQTVNMPIQNLSDSDVISNIEDTATTTNETVSIDLYIQNKEVAATSDCSVTRRVTRDIPRTSSVIDASLEILFDEELSNYGVYESVVVSNGVARVNLASDMTPTGSPISSLSSCEAGHLVSVVSDTLTQYDNVETVELYSPNGPIEF